MDNELLITLYAGFYDVQIIKNICLCIIIVVFISAVARCIMKLIEYVYDYKKTFPKETKEDNEKE